MGVLDAGDLVLVYEVWLNKISVEEARPAVAGCLEIVWSSMVVRKKAGWVVEGEI